MLRSIEKSPARKELHSKITELSAALSGRESALFFANASLEDVKDIGGKVLKLYEAFKIEAASMPGAFQADLKAATSPERAAAPVILALTALDGLSRFGSLGGKSEQEFQCAAAPLISLASEALSMVHEIKAGNKSAPAPGLDGASLYTPVKRAGYFIEHLPALQGEALSQALTAITERLHEGTRFFTPGERAKLFGVVQKLEGREDLSPEQRKTVEEFLYGD